MATTRLKRDVESPLDRIEQAQAQLRAVERQIAQAHRLTTLGTLAAGVAHEINNILTPVLSYAHLAQSRRDDEELQAKAFDKIIAGVESACEVAQAMLNYSRDADEKPVADVGAVVQSAIGCLGRDPAKDSIQVDVRIGEGTCVHIRPLALQQVLLNLILNARSALMGRRGATIVIEARPGSEGRTSVTVSDNGPGIPEEAIATVFEPFVSSGGPGKASADPALPTSGAGLGLMVTRHLVSSAGGTITVSSTPGEGATFVIDLPSAELPSAESASHT
jgi:signal transduction histidine kinase